MNGGKATWFGIEVPFDLNALLAFVSWRAAGTRGTASASGFISGSCHQLNGMISSIVRAWGANITELVQQESESVVEAFLDLPTDLGLRLGYAGVRCHGRC